MRTIGTTSPEKGPSQAVRLLGHLTELGQVLIPGAYAWAITVVPCATSPSASRWAWVLAFAAAIALVSGCFLSRSRPRLARMLAIWAFLVFSVATWALNPQAIRATRIDALRATSGTLGWMLYALGWGTPWRLGIHPEDDPRAQSTPKLDPRHRPAMRAPLAVALASVGAILVLVLAWRSAEPNRALLLQGVALACAIALVSAAARVAVAQGHKPTMPTQRQRVSYALPWLIALAASGVVALAWWLSL